MNHLAHLFLAGPSDLSLLGNLSGDFVKGKLVGEFHPEIEQGIRAHRSIDAYTDTHPEIAAFRRIIGHGHYSGVISDIFLDHFLATEWTWYSEESLAEFLRRAFALLDPHVEAMPRRLRAIYPSMRDGEWFQSYASFDGVWSALFHISRRFSRQPRLELAAPLIISARAALLEHFQRFMPDVIRHAKGLQ
jgi:acyl carrier protein phosphodiesterase